MRFSLKRDLGLQLLALYLLFVGPVVIASLVFDRVAAQRLESDVKAADLALARAIAQETNAIMDNALSAVRQLGAYPEVIASDEGGMELLFHLLLNVRSDVNLIYRLDKDGVMVYHYPLGPDSTVGWDFSFRDYFQRALKTTAPLVSTGRLSPTTQQLVTTAVMPIWTSDGQFLGVVATNIKLQSLSHTLASISAEHRSEDGFQIAIVDASGQVIAHPDPQQLLKERVGASTDVTKLVLSGQSGNIIADDSEGVKRLYSYVPVSVPGWGVIISRPTATAFATPRATHRGVLITVAVFLVVGIFFWVALSQRVISPLERLASFSQTIERKDVLPTESRRTLQQLTGRADQIGHLTHSLIEMEEAIAARLAELATLLETSTSVVSSLNLRTVLNRILEQVERLMNIQMCAIVALDENQSVFRVQASRGLSSQYASRLAINPSEPYSVTLRALRSGEPVQISDTEKDASFASGRPRARAEGYRSVLAVPLNTQHAPPAALLVYRPDPHFFTAQEVDLLTSFANHAAMAIENATLYSRSDMRLQEQTRRLEALIQSYQDGLILEDLQGRVLYANRRIGDWVNLPYEEISGASVDFLIERVLARAVEPDASRNAIGEALSGAGSRRIEIGVHGVRQQRYLRLQFFDVTDTSGAAIGRGQIWRDITQNREVDRMKSSLISTVSHELRTPLAAIKGYATTLLADDVQWDVETQHEFLEIISNETDRLSSLVNDLLDMSRIEAGDLSVSYEYVDLEDLIYRAAQRAHPQPQDRLRVNIPLGLPRLYADPQRVEVVLRNLIENAAKYSPEDLPIYVSAQVQEEEFIIRVEDEGPGIPAEHSERIFESFYRVEDGLTRQTPGAGLGLAICRGFVRAHGGDIWLEPKPVGVCIAFCLPLNGHHEDF